MEILELGYFHHLACVLASKSTTDGPAGPPKTKVNQPKNKRAIKAKTTAKIPSLLGNLRFRHLQGDRPKVR